MLLTCHRTRRLNSLKHIYQFIVSFKGACRLNLLMVSSPCLGLRLLHWCALRYAIKLLFACRFIIAFLLVVTFRFLILLTLTSCLLNLPTFLVAVNACSLVMIQLLFLLIVAARVARTLILKRSWTHKLVKIGLLTTSTLQRWTSAIVMIQAIGATCRQWPLTSSPPNIVSDFFIGGWIYEISCAPRIRSRWSESRDVVTPCRAGQRCGVLLSLRCGAHDCGRSVASCKTEQIFICVRSRVVFLLIGWVVRWFVLLFVCCLSCSRIWL